MEAIGDSPVPAAVAAAEELDEQMSPELVEEAQKYFMVGLDEILSGYTPQKHDWVPRGVDNRTGAMMWQCHNEHCFGVYLTIGRISKEVMDNALLHVPFTGLKREKEMREYDTAVAMNLVPIHEPDFSGPCPSSYNHEGKQVAMEFTGRYAKQPYNFSTWKLVHPS